MLFFDRLHIKDITLTEEKAPRKLPFQPSWTTMPAMISLIINADDLGINPERDRGIIEAFENGIVSSATMIANGLSFGTATALAKAAGLAIGIHLNLSDGVTLSGPIKGLTDQSQRLPGKILLRRYLLGEQQDLAGIQRELAAQIEKVMATGLQPTHIDGHQHCHIYPALTKMVIALARQYGLDAIRSVSPAGRWNTQDPAGLLAEDLTIFEKLGKQAHEAMVTAGIRTTQGLLGLQQLHSLDTKALCTLLAELPDGIWELMTHPGYPYPQGSAFEGGQRQTELKALCSMEAKTVIEQHNIRLCTFGDLPCAS